MIVNNLKCLFEVAHSLIIPHLSCTFTVLQNKHSTSLTILLLNKEIKTTNVKIQWNYNQILAQEKTEDTKMKFLKGGTFVVLLICHFQVLLCLCFKTRLRAKPFIWKWVLHAVSFSCKSKCPFHKVSHLDLFWNRGTRQLENGPVHVYMYLSFFHAFTAWTWKNVHTFGCWQTVHWLVLAKPCWGPRLHGPKFAVK